MDDMAYGRYGTWKILYMGDMVHERYGTRRNGTWKICHMGDMIHGRYGTWEIWYM